MKSIWNSKIDYRYIFMYFLCTVELIFSFPLKTFFLSPPPFIFYGCFRFISIWCSILIEKFYHEMVIFLKVNVQNTSLLHLNVCTCIFRNRHNLQKLSFKKQKRQVEKKIISILVRTSLKEKKDKEKSLVNHVLIYVLCQKVYLFK